MFFEENEIPHNKDALTLERQKYIRYCFQKNNQNIASIITRTTYKYIRNKVKHFFDLRNIYVDVLVYLNRCVHATFVARKTKNQILYTVYSNKKKQYAETISCNLIRNRIKIRR